MIVRIEWRIGLDGELIDKWITNVRDEEEAREICRMREPPEGYSLLWHAALFEQFGEAPVKLLVKRRRTQK